MLSIDTKLHEKKIFKVDETLIKQIYNMHRFPQSCCSALEMDLHKKDNTLLDSVHAQLVLLSKYSL